MTPLIEKLAAEFVKNYVTMNRRPPDRPDVLKHAFIAGAQALLQALSKEAGELSQKEIDDLKADTREAYNFGFDEETNAVNLSVKAYRKGHEQASLRWAAKVALAESQLELYDLTHCYSPRNTGETQMSEKPRTYYAVWEDAELNDDDTVNDETGYCHGAISTHGGGSLYWEENQFQVVHKDAYDKLLAENEDLKVYKDQVWSYVQATGNTSPKTLGYHVAEALVMDHKDLKQKLARAVEAAEAYANSMRVALEHGVFPDKSEVSRRIERLLAESKARETLAELKGEMGERKS